MKNGAPDFSSALDAGWEDLPDTSSAQARASSDFEPIAEEEVDAGWDEGADHVLAGGAARSTVRATRPRQAALAERGTAPPGVMPPKAVPPKLGKKERREIERKNRAHASQRRRERKEERRAQRQADEIKPAIVVTSAPVVAVKTTHTRKSKVSAAKVSAPSARPSASPKQPSPSRDTAKAKRPARKAERPAVAKPASPRPVVDDREQASTTSGAQPSAHSSRAQARARSLTWLWGVLAAVLFAFILIALTR